MEYSPDEPDFDPGNGRPVSANSPHELIDPSYVQPRVPEDEDLQPGKPLKSLNARHRRVAYLEMCGYSAGDIARDVGYHISWISQLRANPTYKLYLSELRRKVEENQVVDINQRLQSMTEDTIHTIYNIMMNSENERNRLSAANSLFDRQVPKVNKVQTDNRHSFFIDQESIQSALNAMGECLGLEPNTLKELPTGDALKQIEDLMEKNNGPEK